MIHCQLSEIFARRRSVYALGALSDTDTQSVCELAEQCLKNCPSAFNSQGGRLVVLLRQHHQKLWQLVEQALVPLTPPEKQAAMQERNRAFAAATGTILFFEDQSTIAKMQQQYPLYRDNFPAWSLESAGMLQYMVWLALANKNIGASLQHYNPLIDAAVQQTWQISADWKLLAQMPFGRIEAPAGDKTFAPLEPRLKFFA